VSLSCNGCHEIRSASHQSRTGTVSQDTFLVNAAEGSLRGRIDREAVGASPVRANSAEEVSQKDVTAEGSEGEEALFPSDLDDHATDGSKVMADTSCIPTVVEAG
jgi:hypothetical protein